MNKAAHNSDARTEETAVNKEQAQRIEAKIDEARQAVADSRASLAKLDTSKLLQEMRAERKVKRDIARVEIRQAVRNELIETFRNWGWDKGTSVSYMRGWLRDCPRFSGEAFQRLTTKDQSSVVRSVLCSLEREGFAGTVIGFGVNGGECREWELVATIAKM